MLPRDKGKKLQSDSDSYLNAPLKSNAKPKQFDVGRMLDRQEEVISELLRKYQTQDAAAPISNNDKNTKSRINSFRAQSHLQPNGINLTIDPRAKGNAKIAAYSSKISSYRSIDTSAMSSSRETHLTKQSVTLPAVKEAEYNARKRQNEKYGLSEHQTDRRKMTQQSLYKIYSSVQKKGQKGKRMRAESQRIGSVDKGNTIESRPERDAKPLKLDKNMPLGISTSPRKNKQEQKQINDESIIESDDSDSEEGEVCTAEDYDKQFRSLMKTQCREELNFLYFSRNINSGKGMQVKEWAEALLSLIEKHDKQVWGVRRKKRHLRTMDDQFYSMGVFNQDDL